MTQRRRAPEPLADASRYSRRAALRAGLGVCLASALAPVGAPSMRAAPPVAAPGAAATGARVRVLTVTMDQALARLDDPLGGEASRWVTNHRLTDQIAAAGIPAPVFCDPHREHCLVVTGRGPGSAATAITAVGRSDLLDLSRAYILIAGTGGVAPTGGTLGAAAWAEWVVDGSTANLLGPSRLPAGRREEGAGAEVYQLDPGLANVAYEISKGVALADTAAAAAVRVTYADAAARAAPSVLRGDVVAGPSLPSGDVVSNHPAWWMRQWSGGLGTYVMAGDEDIGTLAALRQLAGAGRVDWRRIMLLRAGSGFDRSAPGQIAPAAFAAGDQAGPPIAHEIALENAYRAGAAVARRILDDWASWRTGPPAAG